MNREGTNLMEGQMFVWGGGPRLHFICGRLMCEKVGWIEPQNSDEGIIVYLIREDETDEDYLEAIRDTVPVSHRIAVQIVSDHMTYEEAIESALAGKWEGMVSVVPDNQEQVGI